MGQDFPFYQTCPYNTLAFQMIILRVHDLMKSTKTWRYILEFVGHFLLSRLAEEGCIRIGGLLSLGSLLFGWGRGRLLGRTLDSLLKHAHFLLGELDNDKTIKVEFSTKSHPTWTFHFYYRWRRWYISRYLAFFIIGQYVYWFPWGARNRTFILTQRKLVPDGQSSYSL